MNIVLGIVAGVALGLLAMGLLPGVPGVILGVVVAALGYVGVSSLTTRERKLGGVAASLLPNGELVGKTLDQAAGLEKSLRKNAHRTRDAEVSQAIFSVCEELDKLVAYVQENPGSNGALAHVINTYGEQCEGVVENWVGLELSGSKRRIANSKEDLLVALQGVRAAVEGELGEATSARAGQIEAASEAIKRLAQMDGYETAVASAAGDAQPAGDAGDRKAGE